MPQCRYSRRRTKCSQNYVLKLANCFPVVLKDDLAERVAVFGGVLMVAGAAVVEVVKDCGPLSSTLRWYVSCQPTLSFSARLLALCLGPASYRPRYLVSYRRSSLDIA